MQSQVLEFGGCEILVERIGKGTPLVVFHAEDGPDAAQAFLEHLSEKFEVHVPRLVGWPKTRRPTYVNTMRDVALVGQEYVERFNRPVAIVGLSVGGWVAAEIAANAPALVSSLVLLSPIGVKIGGGDDRDFADLYVTPTSERTALYYAPGRMPVITAGTNREIYLEKAIADEAVARYCWQPYMHDLGLRGRLRRIRAATLVISGGRDGLVLNPDYYQRFAALIPNAQHERLADAGHRVEEEEPQKVAERIVSFIASSVSARPAA